MGSYLSEHLDLGVFCHVISVVDEVIVDALYEHVHERHRLVPSQNLVRSQSTLFDFIIWEQLLVNSESKKSEIIRIYVKIEYIRALRLEHVSAPVVVVCLRYDSEGVQKVQN